MAILTSPEGNSQSYAHVEFADEAPSVHGQARALGRGGSQGVPGAPSLKRGHFQQLHEASATVATVATVATCLGKSSEDLPVSPVSPGSVGCPVSDLPDGI